MHRLFRSIGAAIALAALGCGLSMLSPSPAVADEADQTPHVEPHAEHAAHADDHTAHTDDAHGDHGTHGPDKATLAAGQLVPPAPEQQIYWFGWVVTGAVALFLAAIFIGIPSLMFKAPEPPDPADHHDDHGHH